MKAPLMMAAFMLLCASACSAYIFEMQHACKESCLQGTEIVFNITVNAGKWKDTMELQKIQVVDSRKGTLIAIYNKTSFISTIKSFYLNATLPKYSGASQLNVSPCFTSMVPIVDRMAEDTFIATELTYCEKANFTVPLLECLYSAGCDASSSCINNQCIPLECDECQYIHDHKCTNFQCCSNETCKQSQTCINNSCIAFECAFDEAPANHTCMKLQCGSDEQILDHACAKIPPIQKVAATNETANNSTKAAASPEARPKIMQRLAAMPAQFTSDLIFRALEVLALGAIAIILVELIEVKTKIFIKLANRGRK
jgi:hypothetical protein